jgi:hypothetical protein
MEGCYDKVSGMFGSTSKVRLILLIRILIAPYENRDGWELNVMSVNGTLYFEEHARLAER